MCTRSVQRVMQLDEWINAAWRFSFRLIRIVHWLLLLWLIWHHSLKFFQHISSLIYLLLCHLTPIGKQKSNLLAVLQTDLYSRTLAWCVRPLHMHRQIILSENLVTEIKDMLTRSKIDNQIAFQRGMTLKIQICLSIPPMTLDPSSCLDPNLISVWWLAGQAICKVYSFQVELSSHS